MQNPSFIVLAGGIGKNFAPLVTNKTVFPFCGQPFIAHTLEMIRQAGASEVIVVCNKENQKLIDQLSNRQLFVRTVVQDEANGQAEALMLARSLVGERAMIVLNAVDVLDSQILKKFVKQAPHTYAQILGMRVAEYFLGGYLQLDGERVTKIIEKPARGQEPSDIANLFFHYFSKPQDLFALLKQEQEKGGDDTYERALDRLLQQQKVNFFVYDSYWRKLKQAHHVLDVTALFLEHKITPKIDRSAHIDKLASITGPVYVGARAKIMAGAVIVGPAYIGDDVIVGNHTLVRNSIIETGSIIGFGSEVARSYIGPNCQLHHNFIGDSVLESKVNPSYGSCTANLRFDGQPVVCKLPEQKIATTKTKLGAIMAKGVFLGINCSVLPGMTLGANATAYPSSIISRPVKAGESWHKD